MAIPFIHVSCGLAPADAGLSAKQPIFGNVQWDEEIASDVASTNRAPDPGNGQRPVFRITADGDRWITIAPVPDNPALAGKRLFFKASEGLQQDVYVNPGDRIRSVAVS